MNDEGHLRFTHGAATVVLDRTGSVLSVSHRRRPGSYLSGFRLDQVLVAEQSADSAGAPDRTVRTLRLGDPTVAVDADEVEFGYAVAGLRVRVRHQFSAGWGIRIALANEGPETVLVGRLQLSWAAGSDTGAVVLAAGAEGALSLHPVGGSGPAADGPVLGGVLRSGSLVDADNSTLNLGPVTLNPGARYVWSWQWDWYRSPRAFGKGRHDSVPATLYCLVGEEAWLVDDPDQSLSIGPGGAGGEDPESPPDELGLIEEDGRLILSSDRPGRWPIELRSRTGIQAYSLTWAAPLAAQVEQLARQVLDGPRTGAGVPRLDDISEGLLLQQAISESWIAAEDDLTDALDRLAGHLPRSLSVSTGRVVMPTPDWVLFLAREFVRTGDTSQADAALEGFLTLDRPDRGIGFAAVSTGLAQMLCGRPLTAVVEHLRALELAAGEAADPAVRLEMAAVTRPADPDILTMALGLAPVLGAGLKGEPLTAMPDEQVAHLVAVFALLPEGGRREFVQAWGIGSQQLARRAAARLLARTAAESRTTQVWLSLVEQVG